MAPTTSDQTPAPERHEGSTDISDEKAGAAFATPALSDSSHASQDSQSLQGSQTPQAPQNPQKKLFHGWWIIAGGFLIMATCYTIFVNCIPLFQSSIVEDLHFSMGQFNTGVSLCTVIAIFASLALGALVDKVSARLLGSFTVIVTAIVLLLLSFMQEIWQFYLLCIVAGMIVVAGTRLLVSVLSTNWFSARRGLAVSIALAGSGFGGIILSPITSWIIDTYSWQTAFLTLAIIALVASLPIVITSFYTRPSDKGLLPYGAGADASQHKDPAHKKKSKKKDTNVTVSVGWKMLRKNGGFWIMVLGFVCMGIVNGAIITNSITNMTSVVLGDVEIITGGHSKMWASYVWMGYLGMVIIGKIFLGFIYDHLGLRVGTVVGTAACVIASIALCFPGTYAGPIIASIAFGFGTCMGTVTPPVQTVKQYGRKDLGMVVGIVTAFELFGAAIGAVVSGLLFDAFHTFVPAWIMALVASVVMGLCLMRAIPAARALVERRRAEGAPEVDEDGNEILAVS